MPRRPRPDLPGIPLHVVQRGNNRQPVFFQDTDRLACLGGLREATAHHGVAVHAWCLMTNHVHPLVTPMRSRALSSALAWLGPHYVPYVNRTYGRTGTLWEGRYRASLMDSESYLLAGHRAAYRRLFESGLETHVAKELEGALVHNHVPGDDRFRAEIERMLGRTIGPGRRGRPRRQPGADSQLEARLPAPGLAPP